MARKPLSQDYVSAWFRRQGFKLLSDYKHSKQHLRFRCKCGSARTATWNNLFNRKHALRCMECRRQEDWRDARVEAATYSALRSTHCNVSEMARQIGMNDADLRKLIHEGVCPRPASRIPGYPRYYYSPREAARLVRLANAFRGRK